MKPNSSESTSNSSGSQLVGSQSYKIITQYGDMLVIKQGIQHNHHHHNNQHNRHNNQSSPHHHHHHAEQQQTHQARPVIMTFHDIGLNSELQFARFCDCDEVKLMLQTFTMIHVNFIGQEFDYSTTTTTTTSSTTTTNITNNQQTNSSSNNTSDTHTNQNKPPNLPDDFKYPNVDQMAESIVDICTQLKVRSFIGLAVGAGAYIVSSLALMRPDLIDGLFLINPVITSCSITEWLYFKMSAIASNHHLSGGGGGGPAVAAAAAAGSGSGSSAADSPGSSSSALSSPKSGLRKLISAATHLHLSHHHNDQHQSKQHNAASSNNAGEHQSSENSGYHADDTRSIGQGSIQSSQSISNTQEIREKLKSSSAVTTSGSRLRQLIFSRNLRNIPSTSSSSLINQTATDDRQQISNSNNNNDDDTDTDNQDSSSGNRVLPLAEEPNVASKKLGPSDENSSSSSSSQHKSGGKRAPFEYLMYHHFGPASFQRYRRSSDTSAASISHGNSQSELDNTPRSSASKEANQQQQQAAAEVGSTSSRHSSPASASGGSLGRTNSARSGNTGSAGTGAGGSGSGSGSGGQRSRRRSGSVCMNATYLASFSNDRQRQAYIQSAYKHYFYQINSHNLWLFAQSFVKRRTLNLRKDCGAAAHAAAAAATLGTSICTAFVGLAPVPPTPSSGNPGAGTVSLADRSSSDKDPMTKQPESGTTSTTTAAAGTAIRQAGDVAGANQSGVGQQQKRQSAVVHSTKQQQQQQQQQALVAGTKVKRTFTCQTLIMCSSVPMHCERAFKLMSLLNPLQATWIKTDHLLVLEERPDKVCQALRLFLQGIGYSMSTYERRLRLSSTTGSAGSADSSSSARSYTADTTT